MTAETLHPDISSRIPARRRADQTAAYGPDSE